MGTVTAQQIPVWFLEQMTRLLGLKFAPADMVTHWEALRDVPPAVLEAAVTRAQRTRTDFPTPVELRQDADAVHHLLTSAPDEDRGQDLAAPVVLGTLPSGKVLTAERVWRYYHEECADTGTESLWCGEPSKEHHKPWVRLQACERTTPHDPHEWVRKCTCWESNPALIRKRERQQKFAEAKGRT